MNKKLLTKQNGFISWLLAQVVRETERDRKTARGILSLDWNKTRTEYQSFISFSAPSLLFVTTSLSAEDAACRTQFGPNRPAVSNVQLKLLSKDTFTNVFWRGSLLSKQVLLFGRGGLNRTNLFDFI